MHFHFGGACIDEKDINPATILLGIHAFVSG
jgi:hypothetical protein